MLNAKFVEGPMCGTGVDKRAKKKKGTSSPRSSISDGVPIEDGGGHRLKPLVLMAAGR